MKRRRTKARKPDESLTLVDLASIRAVETAVEGRDREAGPKLLPWTMCAETGAMERALCVKEITRLATLLWGEDGWRLFARGAYEGEAVEYGGLGEKSVVRCVAWPPGMGE